ncbi:hypothetical protein FQZ97_807390 [compost metagenome]
MLPARMIRNSPESTLTAVLLAGGGGPKRLAPSLPGITSISSQNTLLTIGTRFSSNSQPLQPMSCRRCTPICTLTTSMPITTAMLSRPPSISEILAAIATTPMIPVTANISTSDQAR